LPWFFCKLEDLPSPTSSLNLHVQFLKRMRPWGFFFPVESFASIGNLLVLFQPSS
jgi:hypothetical protein